jgi:phage terminase large subunit GpA-like protein
MNEFSNPETREIVLKWSSQVGKSEVKNNVVGYFIDIDPCPILDLEPTVEMGETWSNDRLSPMIRDTPSLRKKIGNGNTKTTGNKILYKKFAGGHITIAGANSPASLASRPIRVLLRDERNRYPASAGKEGDPAKLAQKRTATFWNSKVGDFSSPTIPNVGVSTAYENSDKRKFHVPCRHCGTRQVLKWSSVHWDKNKDGEHEPDTAVYVCEHCGVCWDDADRHNSVSKGKWIAEKPFDGVAGFHISQLYSPWVKLASTVREFLEAINDREKMQVFTNTALAEDFVDESEEFDEEDVKNRREEYMIDSIPAGVVLITAAVDVQKDRLEYDIQGWGAKEECWGLEHGIIYGAADDPETWVDLDEKIKGRKIDIEDGRRLRIHTVCVDSSAYTDYVYKYVRRQPARLRFLAIKGKEGERSIWPERGKKTKISGNLHMYIVGVDAAKYRVLTRIEDIKDVGARYYHFAASYDDEFFEQIPSEKRVMKMSRGKKIYTWEQTRDRNEGLDLLVYNMAAMLSTKIDLDQRARNIKTRLEKPEKPEEKEETIHQTRKAAKSRKTKRGGFVKNY